MTECGWKLKSLLMKVKKEIEKSGLKFNVPKMKIMASGSITSWQIDGETMEKRVFSWVTKSLQMVTAVMKLKDVCFLAEKTMTNLGSMLKSRDISLPTKVR